MFSIGVSVAQSDLPAPIVIGLYMVLGFCARICQKPSGVKSGFNMNSMLGFVDTVPFK